LLASRAGRKRFAKRSDVTKTEDAEQIAQPRRRRALDGLQERAKVKLLSYGPLVQLRGLLDQRGGQQTERDNDDHDAHHYRCKRCEYRSSRPLCQHASVNRSEQNGKHNRPEDGSEERRQDPAECKRHQDGQDEERRAFQRFAIHVCFSLLPPRLTAVRLTCEASSTVTKAHLGFVL
jgi:hypothetical protein